MNDSDYENEFIIRENITVPDNDVEIERVTNLF